MKPTVLIAEDEDNLALNLQFRLNALGYDAKEIVATSGDAIRVAGLWKPNIILMDITLENGEDGIETASAINQFLNVPIVYVTASNDPSILERAKNTNCYGYIMKPCDERNLVRSIEIALARSAIQNRIMASERMFRHIFENSGDHVILLDKDCKIIDCNKQTLDELPTPWTNSKDAPSTKSTISSKLNSQQLQCV